MESNIIIIILVFIYSATVILMALINKDLRKDNKELAELVEDNIQYNKELIAINRKLIKEVNNKMR